jgi:hypothetical protein
MLVQLIQQLLCRTISSPWSEPSRLFAVKTMNQARPPDCGVYPARVGLLIMTVSGPRIVFWQITVAFSSQGLKPVRGESQ